MGSVHGVVRVAPRELGASAALGGEVVVGVELDDSHARLLLFRAVPRHTLHGHTVNIAGGSALGAII